MDTLFKGEYRRRLRGTILGLLKMKRTSIIVFLYIHRSVIVVPPNSASGAARAKIFSLYGCKAAFSGFQLVTILQKCPTKSTRAQHKEARFANKSAYNRQAALLCDR